jgi:hypothetical protein
MGIAEGEVRASDIGLPLIYVPRVPVGNTENYRVCRSQPADFAQVPVRQGTAVFSAEIARNSLAKTASLTGIFLGKFQRFSRNRNRLKINDLPG